jgi:hypothetical protein
VLRADRHGDRRLPARRLRAPVLIFATISTAAPFLVYTAAVVGTAVLLTVSAYKIWIGEIENEWAPPHAGRMALAALLGLASLPAWLYGLIFGVFAVAAMGCPPDVYQCPV